MFERKKIRARVASISYDDVVALKGSYWALFVDFKIIGLKEHKVHSERIYTLICSKDYQTRPCGDTVVDEKTIVLDELDKPHIEKYITDILDQINGQNLQSWAEYYDMLKKSFHVDES